MRIVEYPAFGPAYPGLIVDEYVPNIAQKL